MIKPQFSISALFFAFLVATVLLLAEVVSHVTLYNNLIVKLTTVRVCDIYLTNLEYAISRYSLLVLDELLSKLGREGVSLSLVEKRITQELDFEGLAETVSHGKIKASVTVLRIKLERCSGGRRNINKMIGLPVNVPSDSLDLILDLIITISYSNNDTGVRRRIKLVINHPIRLFGLLRIRREILLMNSTSYAIEEGVENVTDFILGVIKHEFLKRLDCSFSLNCLGTITPKECENSSAILYVVEIHGIKITDELQNTFLKAKEIKVNDRIFLRFVNELNSHVRGLSNETSTFHLFLKKN